MSIVSAGAFEYLVLVSGVEGLDGHPAATATASAVAWRAETAVVVEVELEGRASGGRGGSWCSTCCC